MTEIKLKRINGRDLKVGDYVRVIGTVERVAALEPYDGPLAYLGEGEPVYIARFPSCREMMIFPQDWLEVAE